MIEDMLADREVHSSVNAALRTGFQKAAGGQDHLRGRQVLSLLRKHELVRRDDGMPFGVCGRKLYDETFKPLAKPLQEVYHSKERKTASDFMFMANAVMAYGGKHSKLHQIGVRGPSLYAEWVDADAFEDALRRLSESMDGEDIQAFAREATHEDFQCQRGGVPFVGVGAVVDCVTTASACANLVASDEITNAQRLQALVGAYLIAHERQRPFRCVVNSYWRGERSCATVSNEAAPAFFEALRKHMQADA